MGRALHLISQTKTRPSSVPPTIKFGSVGWNSQTVGLDPLVVYVDSGRLVKARFQIFSMLLPPGLVEVEVEVEAERMSSLWNEEWEISIIVDWELESGSETSK